MISTVADRPRRVLIGAYACGPVAEPEARAGWELARAAASGNDVWVITRPRFRPAIEEALTTDEDLRRRLRVTYLDLSPSLVRRKRRAVDLYWYYPLWQRAAGRLAREMHIRIGFDVAHHATFANDWMPSGLTALRDVPLVWGPVGGTSAVPVRRLARWLGARGTVIELSRSLVTGAIRAISGDRTARRAALVVAQNPDVAAHFADLGAATTVEPNASLSDLPPRSDSPTPRTAVFAGRLIALKGATIAIDAIARLRDEGWRLIVFGDGYQARQLRRRAHRHGVADRVEFRGHRPRQEVLRAVAAAEVFLFPSMRDQAGWAVAEASSIGCPAVVLPLGGPPLLARPNAHVASLSGDVVGNVADAVRAAAAAGGRPHDRWSIERLPARVAQWYDMAQAVQPGARRPGRPLRVLESFRSPRPTTNPYITQLHEALRARPDLRVRTFTHTRGLWGRYDLVHLHWPELFVGGHTVAGRTARRLLTVALVTRWRLTGVPIVRTVHNLERPDGLSRLDGRLLDDIDRCTLLDIRLNHHTTARPGVPATTILHGDYRRWFAQTAHAAAAQPVAGRIAYVGLVRRYKGVEGLVRAFRHMDDATATLHIAGRPSSDDLRDLLERAAKDDPRITVDPRYLDESELVEAVTSAQLVVLPYRHMHNSGTVLAALSLGRPVLVPDTAVNRALAAEVGEAWVLTFSGELSAGRLRTALTSTATLPTQPPDLSARQWESAAAAHVAAFDRARNRTARRHEDNRNVDSTLPEAIAFAAVTQYCKSRSETERADIR